MKKTLSILTVILTIMLVTGCASKSGDNTANSRYNITINSYGADADEIQDNLDDLVALVEKNLDDTNELVSVDAIKDGTTNSLFFIVHDNSKAESAYDIAVRNGFTGTETMWLSSLIGPQGPAGLNGLNGKDGLNGAKGDKGDTGAAGKDGTSSGGGGTVLTIGNNGNWYLDGIDSGVKAQGEKGADGTNGSVVTIGNDNYWYIDGVNSGVLAIGRDGVDGTNGVDGRDGKDGMDGKDGVNGVDGRDGMDGKDGTNGVDGRDGMDGRDGANGADGAQGEKGEKGDPGEAGPPGTNGQDGVGIASVSCEQNTDPGGATVCTIALTDGQSTSFSVYNGQ